MTTDSAVPESVHKATTHPVFSQCLLKWILLVCVHFLSGLCQIICSDQQMSSVFLSRQDSSHENACLNRGNASRRSWERSIMGYSDMLWLNGTTSKGYRKTTHWLKKNTFLCHTAHSLPCIVYMWSIEFTNKWYLIMYQLCFLKKNYTILFGNQIFFHTEGASKVYWKLCAIPYKFELIFMRVCYNFSQIHFIFM